MSSRRSPRSKRRRERYFGDRDRATGRVVRSVVTRVAGYAGTRAPDRPESGLLESGGDRSLERVELEKESNAAQFAAGPTRPRTRSKRTISCSSSSGRWVSRSDVWIRWRSWWIVVPTVGSRSASASRPTSVRRGSDRRSRARSEEFHTDGRCRRRGRSSPAEGTTTERTVVAEAKPIRSGRRWIRWIVIGTRKSGTAHWINATGRFDECDSIQASRARCGRNERSIIRPKRRRVRCPAWELETIRKRSGPQNASNMVLPAGGERLPAGGERNQSVECRFETISHGRSPTRRL